MEVSLRKADQLANAIKELLQTNNEIAYGVNLNIWDNAWRDKVKAQRAETETRITRLTKLHLCLSSIRTQIGRANAESGINDLLAKDNLYKNLIAMLTPISQAPVAESDDVVDRTLRSQQQTPRESRYGWDSSNHLVSTNVFDAAYLDKVKAEISDFKKLRREISDELIAKNVTVKVKLPAEVVETLQAENLI